MSAERLTETVKQRRTVFSSSSSSSSICYRGRNNEVIVSSPWLHNILSMLIFWLQGLDANQPNTVFRALIVSLISYAYTLCLKKCPTFDLLLSWHTLSHYDNFWQKCYCESTKSGDAWFSHLTYLSASALHCEIGNPEDSALVYYACNTTSAALSTDVYPEPCTPTARAERIDYKI